MSRNATINENSVSHTASGWNNECEQQRRVIKTGAFCQAWIFGNHRKYANKTLPQRIRINGQQIFAHVGGILCVPVFRYPESMFGCICIWMPEYILLCVLLVWHNRWPSCGGIIFNTKTSRAYYGIVLFCQKKWSFCKAAFPLQIPQWSHFCKLWNFDIYFLLTS